MTAYYNEFDPYVAQWLRNLIAAGHIPAGDVDDRSILDVRPADLIGYDQCHFFAGIGGWPLAARLAGWPADRPLWTGSCPCQPFSVAGRQKGTEDERHLWPVFFDLIRAVRPSVVFGEQVAAAAGAGWLDGVLADLEGQDYACGAAIIPACSVDTPHRRDRLWFVADATGERRGEGRPGDAVRQRDASALAGAGIPDGDVANSDKHGRPALSLGGVNAQRHAEPCRALGNTDRQGSQVLPGERGHPRPQRAAPVRTGGRGFWAGAEWRQGADGKARRVKPGIRLLVDGLPARVAKLRALGNAIVPQVAAEFLGAYLDSEALFDLLG